MRFRSAPKRKPRAPLSRTQTDIERLILEGRSWLRLAKLVFNFWDNEEDEIWNEV